ncbi:MAG: PAS domain S-box protein, partial [Dehalococcoidales bacterium]|nr:PAS domain S-box protein [Dehalococcoidales bacterium]
MEGKIETKVQSIDEVKRRLNFEKLISRVLSQFVGTFDIDNAINASLEEMGRFSGADRVYIFLINEDQSTIDNTHEWCSEGISPQIDDQKKLPVESFPWWAGKLRSGELIHISDIAGMPADAANEKQLLDSQGVRSLLVLPVYVRGEPVGFIGFDANLEPRVWKEEDIILLRAASEIIGNALARVRLEGELRDGREKYRAVFENTGTATVILEEDMIISLANEEFGKLSGYPREEVEGKKRWTEFVAKEDMDMMIRHHRSRRVKDGSAPRNYEFRFIDREGNTKHILLTAAMIPGTGKSVASLVDITGRKEIEDALRESEGQYRSLINLGGEVGEAVVMLQDTDQGEGIQVFVSDRWLHITGYYRKELIGTSFFNLVHPDSRKASLERHRRKMKGEVIPGLFEMLVVGKDGTEVPVELTSAYTTYRGGHADVIYVRDITERKRIEEALEQERALFVSGPTVVFKWIAADGWPIDYVSPNVYGLLGYTAEELMDG